ncbi:hypothetical protein DBR06_SOUSAS2610064, partial [Sousa chinensis]
GQQPVRALSLRRPPGRQAFEGIQ